MGTGGGAQGTWGCHGAFPEEGALQVHLEENHGREGVGKHDRRGEPGG